MASEDTISSTVNTMTDGVVVTIFIVVTHLVGFVLTRRINGLLGVLNLFLDRSLVMRCVYGSTADTKFCL